MVQNRNKLIELFVGNLSNSIVHEILERAVSFKWLVDKYDKEMLKAFNSSDISKKVYDIFMPMVTASIDVSTATVTYSDETFTLLNLMNYQQHSEGILI